MALNATSVGVGRRKRFFFSVYRRNCIIIIITIVFVVVVVIFQNCQMMVTSFGIVGIVGTPPEPRLLEFLQRLGEDGYGGWVGGGWKVIAVFLLKMYVRLACKI